MNDVHDLGSVFLLGGATLDRSAVAIGLMAAAIAVGAFLGRAWEILVGVDEEAIERATIIGGVAGLVIALLLISGDALAG